MRIIAYIVITVLTPLTLFAQRDSLESKLVFNGDFRFRIEQDWNSRKSDGSFREDMTRLRYRGRIGATYNYNQRVSFGLRLRTGYPEKQQDPQLTIGDRFNEFGTLPISFEKLYFKWEDSGFNIWLGKNTFPFKKQNELFWSDNVYPEGVSLSKKLYFKSEIIETLKINAAHLIFIARGLSFNKDSYFQGVQLHSTHWNNKLELFPAIYYSKNTPNIPDGNETFFFDYTIFHLGAQLKLLKKPALTLEVDYYYNLEDYQNNDSIPTTLRNQKTGLISGLSLGRLQEKGNWQVIFTYTYLQRYAAVDFFAQNDWARWDYASVGSPDGRLTNFKGFEVTLGYAIDKNLILKMKYYKVEQLIPYGIAKETGSRVRLDLDISF